MGSLLEMRNISKRYPGVVALDDVSISIGESEIVSLIGENGAGKSTLMKILGGVARPDSGKISIAGTATEIDSPITASRNGIEFIHQELSVLDNLDVAANIFLRREPTTGGFLKIIDRSKIYAAADTYLKKVGLNFSSRTPLRTLSIAQQQLVEIARALSAGARAIIMDEPTSSLTLTETRRLLDIIRDLKTQGVSVIYISHRLDEVIEISDRVIGLRDGKNAGELQKAEITRENMVRMMVGRDLKDFYVHAGGDQARHDQNWLVVNGLRTTKYPGQEISFTARQGEVLGVAGLVGAGRSEMARAVFGVDPILGGEISLAGKKLSIQSPRDAINEGIYLAPEDRRQSGLLVDFNVRENISLPGLAAMATAGLVNVAGETQLATEMVKQINIKTPTPEMRAGNLSGGNQQKVVLAKWLALKPRVLIFDEPTRGIDVGAKAEIYSLMRKVADTGVAIIAISSDMEEVLGISDRLMVMHEGKISGMLERKDFAEETVMRLATGG